MNSEWFEIAWINFSKAILHGQMVDDAGNETLIEKVLSDAERERVYDIRQRHAIEMDALLRELAA